MKVSHEPGHMFPIAEIPDRETVTAIILRERDLFLGDDASTYEEINQGMCNDFARAVLHETGCREGPDVRIMHLEMLQEAPDEAQDFEDFMGQPFDMARIAGWPGIVPPEGFTWDDLDNVSGFHLFDAGTHSWLYLGGRHYDCEAPDGVRTPFDLPFFGRRMREWVAAGRPEVVVDHGNDAATLRMGSA